MCMYDTHDTQSPSVASCPDSMERRESLGSSVSTSPCQHHSVIHRFIREFLLWLSELLTFFVLYFFLIILGLYPRWS